MAKSFDDTLLRERGLKAAVVNVACDRVSAPETTVTVGRVDVTALPPIVAVIVSLPTLVPVNVAV